MAFAPSQVKAAQQKQEQAARDLNPRVRLIAGPGTGKSRCIEERVDYLLSLGVPPPSIFVISFTRASSRDLAARIVRCCQQRGRGQEALAVNVSTMHSLALRTLRNANLLRGLPANPVILDDWEQEKLFDAEFIRFDPTLRMTYARAEEIRLAYDAHWQTMQALQLYQSSPPISSVEQQAFTSYHQTTRLVYSCMLPGEVVRRCVEEMRMGNINPAVAPGISHLIVDEYQDLNACDQEFVQRIADSGASLFVAGDDDQSIYSFRYAAPAGIQQFDTTYARSTTHQLQHCFRCAPAVLAAASDLIEKNPGRLAKKLTSLHATATPPVGGSLHVWRFGTAAEEARAIAQSCRDLIAAGLNPKEILILLSNRKVLLAPVVDELKMLDLPHEQPAGYRVLDEAAPRLVFSLLRVIKDPQDYVAHRTVLGTRHGVGVSTCAGIAQKVVTGNLNFLDLFYAPYPTGLFSPREERAIQSAVSVFHQISTWNLADTLQVRGPQIDAILAATLDAGTKTGHDAIDVWRTLARSFVAGMNLDELLSYLWSDTEAGQLQVMEAVAARLGQPAPSGAGARTGPGLGDRIRILTMHGAKGLDAKVVFIPGVEDHVIPHDRALKSPGLFHEQRRLLYVSITRAKAACVLSLARTRIGQAAFALTSTPLVQQNASQFLTDIGIPPQYRSRGFTSTEVAGIVADCSNIT